MLVNKDRKRSKSLEDADSPGSDSDNSATSSGRSGDATTPHAHHAKRHNESIAVMANTKDPHLNHLTINNWCAWAVKLKLPVPGPCDASWVAAKSCEFREVLTGDFCEMVCCWFVMVLIRQFWWWFFGWVFDVLVVCDGIVMVLWWYCDGIVIVFWWYFEPFLLFWCFLDVFGGFWWFLVL